MLLRLVESVEVDRNKEMGSSWLEYADLENNVE
jgi:hypothetical protein